MSNHMDQVRVHEQRLDPAEAELWISVIAEHVTPTTEIRGRLMGPRCIYSSTVEVAYPLRPFSRKPEGLPELSLRVVIPEASLWEPECPFLYQGPIELWEDGRRCDQRQLVYGLRSLSLLSRGLYLSGRPMTIQGVAQSTCTADEARRLHQAGYNMILIPAIDETTEVWPIADREGLWVLGQINKETPLERIEAWSQHVSCFGWLFSSEMSDQGMPDAISTALRNQGRSTLLGMELTQMPVQLPSQASFLTCSPAALSILAGISLPKIVLSQDKNNSFAERSSLPAGILGWIAR